MTDPAPPTDAHKPDRAPPLRDGEATPVVRTLLTGGLMGVANLVPGVSGGTMVLVMGLYDRFVASVADLSRGRFSRPAVLFLGLIVAGAAVTFVGLSGLMTDLVRSHQSVMYALFIGMTLAGVPVLWRMCLPVNAKAVALFVVGLGVMLAIAFTEDTSAKEAARAVREAGDFVPVPDVVRDLFGGALAMSAMILPGISGAYMLLLLGRYEHVTGSVSLLKDLARGDTEHAATVLQILGPTFVGAILSLVLLSNLLKWLLANHERAMAGGLLGILIGSAFAIWPFDATGTPRDYGLGAAAFVAGLASVLALTFLVGKPADGERASAVVEEQ